LVWVACVIIYFFRKTNVHGFANSETGERENRI